MADDEKISHAAALVELKRGLLTYRAFEHAAQVIQILTDHDKTLASLEHRIATSKKDYEANLARYQKELDDIAATVAKAREEAARTADADRKTATDLIAAANKEADGIKEHARRKLSAAEAGVTDANNRRQLYEESISQKRAELADLRAKIKEAQEQIAKILEAS